MSTINILNENKKFSDSCVLSPYLSPCPGTSQPAEGGPPHQALTSRVYPCCSLSSAMYTELCMHRRASICRSSLCINCLSSPMFALCVPGNMV